MVWKEIPGWEGLYDCNTNGLVRSRDRRCGARNGHTMLRRGRVLEPVLKSKRYWAVTLADGERRKQIFVHDLVLLTFCGPKPKGKETRHKNDDKNNNHRRNLCYGTPAQNTDDRYKNQRIARGHQHGMAKLTERQVRWVRYSGLPGVYLAERLGVSPGTISSIRSYKLWRHI